jgi:uncharacterized linocin/CFP29 family protein
MPRELKEGIYKMDDVQRKKVGWTDAQWAAIDSAVTTEVSRVRVLDEIIPTTTVGANDKTVTIDRINAVTRAIDDETTIPLPEISVYFELDKQQINQPELTRALALIRRAASDFARLEDAVLLRGLQRGPNGYQPDGYPLPMDADIQRGQSGVSCPGLAGPANEAMNPGSLTPQVVSRPTGGQRDYGPEIVAAVAEAIVMLELGGHMGPYHLILGQAAFIAALTPNPPALVLPKDRIEPLLASLIRRAPALESNEGVLLSVGGDPTDRVVAVEPTVRFVETTARDRYRFRVYGVLTLRRKEPEAAVRLEFPNIPAM